MPENTTSKTSKPKAKHSTTVSCTLNNNNAQNFPPSFFRVAQQVLRQLVNHNSSCSVLLVAWRKIKESGMELSRSTILILLNALSNSRYFNSTTVDDKNKVLRRLSREEVVFLEEIAMYHDLLHGQSEATVSLRTNGLLSKSKNVGAEDFVETPKVRMKA